MAFQINRKDIKKKLGGLFREDRRHIFIFLLFFSFMLLQHSFIFMYQDDYGYASLSYGHSIKGVEGRNFGFTNIIEYLIWHYDHWGGRVLYIFFEIIILKQGLFLFRLIQPFVLTLILFFSFKIASRHSSKKNYLLLSAFMCLLYGLVSIETLRESVYWASASFVYVWPILFLLAGAYQHIKYCECNDKNTARSHRGLSLCALSVCFFLSGFSQEQIGAAAAAYAVLSLVIHVREDWKKYMAVDAVVSVSALSGYLFLVLAPGNMARLNSTGDFAGLSIVQKMVIQTPKVILANFGPQCSMFWIILSLLLIFASYRLIKTRRGPAWLNYASMPLYALYAIIFCAVKLIPVTDEIIHTIKSSLTLQLGGAAFFFAYVMLTVYTISVYFISQTRLNLLILFFCGVASQMVMTVAPGMGFRTQFVFLFFIFLTMGSIFEDFLTALATINFKPIYIVALLAIPSVINSAQIIDGYAVNSNVHVENREILTRAEQDIKNNKRVEEVTLHRLPKAKYSGIMPYEGGYDYINSWIKKYYNIPADVRLIWQ